MWLLRAIQSLRPAYSPSAPTHERQALRPLRQTLAIALTLALLLSGGIALAAPGAAYADAGGHRNHHAKMDYLALGDSVAFGTNPRVTDPSDPNNFIGYPTPVANALGLRLTNAACPGVTSGYFVSLSLPDWECIPFRSNYPLHVNYDTSQLQFAVSFLKSHPRTRLVTIDLGANDLLKLRFDCQNDVACIQRDLPATLANFAAHLNTIYSAIRHEAHYHGQLVALTIYSPDYRDQLTTGSLVALNQVITDRTRAWGGAIADGFDAFADIAANYGGDTCAAGLLAINFDGTCDIHPSIKGRNILAAAIVAVVRHNKDKSVAA